MCFADARTAPTRSVRALSWLRISMHRLEKLRLHAPRPAQAVKLDKVSDMLKSVDLKSVDLAPKSARAVLSAIR